MVTRIDNDLGRVLDLLAELLGPEVVRRVQEEHPEVLAQLRQYAERSHEPARPGTYSDRTRHERDRKAKWGSLERGRDGRP